MTRRGISAVARGRMTLALLVAGCLGLVGVAIAGQVPTPPGLDFVQVGHWVYSSGDGSAVHVDGSTNQVNARASVPGVAQGSQVVQGPRTGYVVERSKITVFGKSTLSVEDALTPPAPEIPVVLEVAGGPYLVYRNAGQVVRLGDPTTTVGAGGPLSRPVATKNGTLWVHRTDNGALCELPPDATRLACSAHLPQGHNGSLTIVDDQPVLVDTTTDTLHPVTRGGIGDATQLGIDLPATAQVATGTARGRLAVIDPDQGRLHVVDAAGLGQSRPVAKPVTVDLPRDGRYAGPVASEATIAVVDEKRGDLLTYDSSGAHRKTTKVPGAGGPPRLAQGEDNRIYVDSADGSHVLVVDGENGAVVGVDTGDPTGGTTKTTPATPGSAPGAGTPTDTPTGTPAPTTGTSTPAPPPPPVQTTRPPQPPPAPPKPVPPPVAAATPPGAPRNVGATAADASATVTWAAATPNGAPVTAYHLSWPGGSTRVGGSTLRANLTGLTNGTSYAVTVVAENSAGRGPGATARAVVPLRPAAAPQVTLSATAAGVTTVRWAEPDLGGGALVHYLVTASGYANRQLTETTTQYPYATGAITVVAVTRFGPAGAPTMTGAPGSATSALPPKLATGAITRVVTTGPDSISVTAEVVTNGSPTTCEWAVGYGAPIMLSGPCMGTITVPLRGVTPGPAGYHHITLDLLNAAGKQAPIVWVNVPQPGSRDATPVLLLAVVALLVAHRRKGKLL